jgi:hypothetical protein
MNDNALAKSLGQIAWEAFADSIGGGPVWFGDGRRDEKAWEDAAQACVVEIQRQHQLEMGYYPSMLEKSENEAAKKSELIERLKHLLRRASLAAQASGQFDLAKEIDEAL